MSACALVGADPAGWMAPRDVHVVPSTPTPELVHGVSVSSPYLAATLRRAGAFGGHAKHRPDRLDALPPLRRAHDGDTVVVDAAPRRWWSLRWPRR